MSCSISAESLILSLVTHTSRHLDLSPTPSGPIRKLRNLLFSELSCHKTPRDVVCPRLPVSPDQRTRHPPRQGQARRDLHLHLQGGHLSFLSCLIIPFSLDIDPAFVSSLRLYVTLYVAGPGAFIILIFMNVSLSQLFDSFVNTSPRTQ